MCGLFGTTLIGNKEINRQLLRSCLNCLQHRGPDAAADWSDSKVYIGHRRLSIVDLSSAGKQPFINLQHSVIVTVNGEIYNHCELRKELELAGYNFKSNSDSEVVVYGYSHWGIEGLVTRLDGMYSAIIYDKEKKKILAFRDRFGIKPLYYTLHNGGLSWSSELSALLKLMPEIKNNLDHTALYDFLFYRYIPAPKSAFKEIKKLHKAQILEFNIRTGEISFRKYWSLKVNENCNKADIETEIRGLIKSSVKSQMMSDVPVGFLLSGGIDSSIVTTVASEFAQNSSAFTVSFPNSKDNELTRAKELCSKLKVHHVVRNIKNLNTRSIISGLRKLYCEPFADVSSIPTSIICEKASQEVTVALSGDGADELFGGYNWYVEYENLQKNRFFSWILPKKGIPFLNKFWKTRKLYLFSIGDPLEQYGQLRAKIDYSTQLEWKKRLNIPEDYDYLWAYRPHFNPSLGIKKSAQIIDFHTYLPDDILTKVDRASMIASIECRPPFLSKDIVEYAFSLTEKQIYKGEQLKGLLKSAFKEQLPYSILTNPKQGFSVQKSSWKKEELQRSIQEEVLLDFLTTQNSRL